MRLTRPGFWPVDLRTWEEVTLESRLKRSVPQAEGEACWIAFTRLAMYLALRKYAPLARGLLSSWPTQPPRVNFGVESMSHISPSSLVVPVLPIQSAPANLELMEARSLWKLVVTRDESTSLSRLCIMVAVALE